MASERFCSGSSGGGGERKTLTFSRLKRQCTDHLQELETGAKFEPKARQKNYTKEVYDENSKKNVTVSYWGVKAEKFYLPLAGQNQLKGGETEFSFFGLKESPMAQHYKDLHDKSSITKTRSDVLYLSGKKVRKTWDMIQTPKQLLKLANDLKQIYQEGSQPFIKIEELIRNQPMPDKDTAVKFLHSLQAVAKKQNHQTPYRMLSTKHNCAGTITNLMELGGAGAFASKPIVLVATSPNDTGDWAERVMIEVDRLNQQANTIMKELQPNEKREPNEVRTQCPPAVWKAYESLDALGTLNVIPHEQLMKEMKALVEAISKANNFEKSVGAILLKAMVPIYAKAGHPIE